MMSTTLQEPQAVSWRYFLKGSIAVSVFIGALIGVAFFVNGQRERSIIAKYTREITIFTSDRKELTDTFFTETFDACQDEYDAEVENLKQSALERNTTWYWPSVITCKAASEMLDDLDVDSIEHSSAIAYTRYKDGLLSVIEASGAYYRPEKVKDVDRLNHYSRGPWSPNTIDEELDDYFQGDKPLDAMWRDFFYYIPGKEVLVPVEIDGRKVGYIFRGVIEK